MKNGNTLAGSWLLLFAAAAAPTLFAVREAIYRARVGALKRELYEEALCAAGEEPAPNADAAMLPAVLRDELERREASIASALARLSNGDLGGIATLGCTARFAVLREAAACCVQQLGRTLCLAGMEAERAEGHAAQMSEKIAALSGGAARHTRLTEQLCAIMKEVASSTRRETDDTGRAGRFAAKAYEGIKYAFSRVQRLSAGVAELERSALAIGECAHLLCDIAFQINIAVLEARGSGDHFVAPAARLNALSKRCSGAAQKICATAHDNAGILQVALPALADAEQAVREADQLMPRCAAAHARQARQAQSLAGGASGLCESAVQAETLIMDCAACCDELLVCCGSAKELTFSVRPKREQSGV